MMLHMLEKKKNINLIRNFLSTALWVFIIFRKYHTFFNATTILMYRFHDLLRIFRTRRERNTRGDDKYLDQITRFMGSRGEWTGGPFWKDPLLAESFETFVEKEVKLKC